MNEEDTTHGGKGGGKKAKTGQPLLMDGINDKKGSDRGREGERR